MRTLTYTVPPEEDGRMVKGILRGDLHLSYTLLKSLKWRENAILLNGQSVHVNAIVHTGDVVSVALSERAPREDLYREHTARPNIVYEDDDLLVLNKPAGVAMHPKADDASAPSLAAMLTGYLGEGSVPHFVSRLDKGTSGLLIAAKSGYAVTPDHGVIDAPIGRADGSIIRRCVRADGLPSLTEYETLQTSERFTLLRMRPQTGRTHQLRVHMAYLGYPLAGDWLYGTEDKNLIARPALHSYELWFTQPITGQELHFTAPIPQDMQRLLASDPLL